MSSIDVHGTLDLKQKLAKKTTSISKNGSTKNTGADITLPSLIPSKDMQTLVPNPPKSKDHYLQKYMQVDDDAALRNVDELIRKADVTIKQMKSF